MKNHSFSDLPRTLLASAFIIALSAGCLWVLSPFLPAILWAITIVVATWPISMWLQTRFHLGRKTASIVMVLTLGLVVLLPLALTFIAILSRADEVVGWTRNLSQIQISSPPAWLNDWPLVGPKVSAFWERMHIEGPGYIVAHIQPYVKTAATWFFGTLGSLGIFFVHLLLTFMIMGALFNSGEQMVAALIRFARKVAGDQGESSVILAGQSIKAVALGVIITATLQSVLSALALTIAGVPRVGLITAFVVVFCVAQIGPLIPMLAGVAWLYAQNSNIAATLLLICAAVLGVSDSFLRPILIRRGADLPFFLIFTGAIGGLVAFGVVGLFIGPLILAVTFRLQQAWVAEGEPVQEMEEGFVSYQKTSTSENHISLPH